jgi:hypothetical protein
MEQKGQKPPKNTWQTTAPILDERKLENIARILDWTVVRNGETAIPLLVLLYSLFRKHPSHKFLWIPISDTRESQ